MADKKSPKETAKIFGAMTKAMVSGNPKPKAKKRKPTIKKNNDN